MRGAGENAEVLMGLKQTGFGTGRIVTLGGHVEPGETPEQAAVREVEEEAAVTVREQDLVRAGSIEFVFPFRPEWDMSTVVFTARAWEGEPSPSEEIIPAWYPVDAVPYAQMWPDSALWMPRVLAGEDFARTVRLDEDHRTAGATLFAGLG